MLMPSLCSSLQDADACIMLGRVQNADACIMLEPAVCLQYAGALQYAYVFIMLEPAEC